MIVKMGSFLHQVRPIWCGTILATLLLHVDAQSNTFTINPNPQSVSLDGFYVTFTAANDGYVWITTTRDSVTPTASQIQAGDSAEGPGGDCKVVNPDPENVTAGVQYSRTFTGCNFQADKTYDVNVYIEDLTGSPGSVAQVDVVLPSTGGVNGDPVTYAGDQKVEFMLPQYTLTTLLETPELRVLAEPLPRDGRAEQWIGRVLVTTAGPKPQPVVEVKIKKLIGWFNRSTAHPDGIETLDVKMDWYMPGRYLRIMPPSDALFNHPHGMSIVVSRMRYTGYELNERLPRREIVFVAGKSVKVAIFSSSANEYFGTSDAHAHLGTKFAHLDVEFFDMHGHRLIKGTLPEIWGFQPLSEETRAMVKEPQEPAIVKIPLDMQSSEDCGDQASPAQGHATA